MKKNFNRILCATDLSEYSNQSIRYAVEFAREFGASLTICHVVDLPPTMAPSAVHLDTAEYQQALLSWASGQIEAMMKPHPVDWEPLVTSGPVAETISALIAEKGIDLAIAATHGRSGLNRLFLGSVTERLIRTLPCPLLITKPAEHPIPEKLDLKRILVGCDFSPDSETALEYGFSLAQEFEAELHLVHILEPYVYRDMFLPVSMLEDLKHKLLGQVNEELAASVPSEALDWCRIRIECIEGQPFRELVRYASKESVDLMVLGVRGRGLVESLLTGSTTDRVIRRGICPVLSVSPGPRKATPDAPS